MSCCGLCRAHSSTDMALQLDLVPGDIIVVPTDSGAQLRMMEKSGRRTRVSVESAKPVHVLRARDERPPSPAAVTVKRPRLDMPAGIKKPSY
jgi:hypothetical protein